MKSLPHILSRLYNVASSRKLWMFIIIVVAVLLVSGFPAYLAAFVNEGKISIAMPDRTTQAVTLKHVAFSPAVAFFYIIGFVGLMGMMQTKNPKYTRFAPLCYGFICVSYGLIILLFKFTLT